MENVVNPQDSNPSQSPFAISVIIPMYNAEKFIAECLDSLLIQTFKNFEVIVVDDCSTDNSLEIVKGYKPKFEGRLTVAQMEKNLGIESIPRNVGFGLSKGEYIFFMDADDFLLNSALETLYNAAKKYNVEVVYSGSYYRMSNPNDVYLYRDGFGKKLLNAGLEDKPDLVVEDPNKLLRTFLTEEPEGNFSTIWTKLCRRDFLIKNNIDFPSVRIANDFIWSINVYCNAKRFLRISPPFYFYRRYNTQSVTQMKRKPSEQISSWTSVLITFMRALKQLESKNNVLSKNPAYCLAAAKRHFEWTLSNIREDIAQLSDEEIYKILYREFNDREGFFDSMTPFFMNFIFADRKKPRAGSQKETKLIPHIPANPVIISVIIPMYNAEKYIDECLDSLLDQTFQYFEVIVVDDCSTDNSVKIVESYAPKFGGRLTLTSMDKNSGSGALPRNKGITLSRGEYIQFLDADDTFTKTALEELYTLAKKYDADVVYCEKYFMSSGVGEEFIKNVHPANIPYDMQQPPFVDEPTFDTEDLSERVKNIVNRKVWVVPWDKLVKRKLLIEQELFFPHTVISEDDIWIYGVYLLAKKFLRVPNMIYIRRMHENSMVKRKRSPEGFLNFWSNPILLGLKNLDNLMSKHEFFKTNPQQRYTILEYFVTSKSGLSFRDAWNFSAFEVYDTIKQEFGDRLGEQDVLISALYANLFKNKKALNSVTSVSNKFKNYITARIDVQMNPKVEGSNLKLLSVSDDKAAVKNMHWLPKGYIGYSIESYVGDLEIVAKPTMDNQIQLLLRGLYVPDPKNASKRIPYWIDYTKLTINGKVIFDQITSAWHDKSYRYNIDAKAGEEIKIKVEWFPHRADVIDKVVAPAPKPPVKDAAPTPKPPATDKSFTPIMLVADRAAEQVVSKFKDYFTARVDIKLLTTSGDFQILNMSDNKAEMKKPNWLQKDGVGYQIQSYEGNLDFVAKASVDGKIQLNLRGLDIRDPKDNSKRIPYWIDYTKLTVNGKIIFDKITSVWHDKFYNHIIDAKAGEEIKIQMEWLPHRGDISDKVAAPAPKPSVIDKAAIPAPKPSVIDKAAIPAPKPPATDKAATPAPKPSVIDKAAIPAPKPPATDKAATPAPKPSVIDKAAIPAPKPPVIDKAAERVINKFKDYFTARVDIKLLTTSGDFQILNMSDNKAEMKKPNWLQKDGVGYQIQSYEGNMDFVAKASVDGKIQLNLRGLDIRDPKDKSKRIPYWIDYTKLTINGKVIFDQITSAWHDKFYNHIIDAKAGEEIKIQVEWLPHKSDT